MQISVPIEELRKCKLMVCTPMYGGACAGMYTRSMADLSSMCTAHGIQLQIFYLFNESLITRARNYCVDEFLRSDATHLMFIDSDIGFSAQDVLALMAIARDQDGDYDVIAGPYPKKCISWEKIKMAVDKGFADENPNNLENFVGDYVFNPKENQSQIKIAEPVEVREVGTGFMMITRKCLEKYRDAYSYMSFKPDHVRTEHFDGTREILAFFDCIIDRGYDIGDLQRLTKAFIAGEMTAKAFKEETERLFEAEKTASKRYLSEDYMFSYYVQKMGGKVWFCPWMKMSHVGTYIFGGSLADLAMIGAPATADANQLKKGKKKS